MRSYASTPLSGVHVWLPGLLVAAAFSALVFGGLDESLARSWAYSPATGWIGRHHWWAEEFLHDGGRVASRIFAGVCLIVAIAARWVPRLADWQRPALYVFLSMLAITVVVGLLKNVTNVDCPWDLSGYGGTRPYVSLFADRPDHLPHAACFPGAHASSGFALFALYFALRERSRAAGLLGLAIAIVVGTAFAIAQEARGAHFLSHDLTSAAFAWYIALALRKPLLTRTATIEMSPALRRSA